MTKRLARAPLHCLAALALVTAAPAATGAEPTTGAEVVDRYLDALGGRDALLAPDDVFMAGTLSMAAQGIRGDVRVWHAKPDKVRIEVELPGLGKTEMGFDGEVGWSNDALTGPRIMTADELAQLRMSDGLMPSADIKEAFQSLELVGRTTFEGSEVHEVHMVPHGGGAPVISYYDVETGLQSGMKIRKATSMGEIPATVVFEKYESYGEGVKLPSRIVTRVTLMGMGFDQVFTLDEFRTGGESPSFAPPRVVQELLEKRRAKSASSPSEGESVSETAASGEGR